MELLQLQYFKIVAKYEHMTRAARELSIAQPSLSQTIKRLEKELGVPLFDRNGRKIKLNRYGKIFLQKTEHALAMLEEGKREVSDLAQLDHDYITLAVMRTPIIPDLLSSFRRLHPFVRFRVKQPSREDMLRQLDSGEIDICISPFQQTDDDIEWQPLMKDDIYLAVPFGHRLAKRTSINLLEAVHEPFILKAGGAFRETTDAFCRQAGFDPDVAFEVEDPLSIRGLVKERLGIAFFSSLTLKTIKDPAIVPLRINTPSCFRTIGLTWNKQRYHSPLTDRFYQFVIQYFARLTQNMNAAGR